MKGRQIKYSAEELSWIAARKTLPRRQLHQAFVKKFDREDVSFDHLKSLCTRKGWKTGRTGCFDKGHVPANKGKKMPFNPNIARTQFKKGQLPHNYKGPGYERICKKDGYVIMIVAETNPHTGADTRPVLKHRWLWEKKYGPVPEGHCLKCLDGDKTNTDPSNWKLIPIAIRPRLNGRFGRGYDEAPEELRPLIMATAELEHKARTLKDGEPDE